MQRGNIQILIIVILAAVVGYFVYTNYSNSQTATPSSTPKPTVQPGSSPSPSVKASPFPTVSPTSSPQPTPTPKVATCNPSTISHPPGTAPYTVYLQGGGSSDAGIVGYQWDFEGNGSWDSDVQLDAKKYTYSEQGSYRPKYRILDKNSNWSKICDYSFTIVVNPAPTATP